MRDRLLRLIRYLVILIGIGILVYPSLSEFLAERNGSNATASYDNTVQQMEQARLNEILSQAQEYNQLLAEVSAGTAPLYDKSGNPVTLDNYWDLLNIDTSGMMGYIEIPCLNISLPIYHGTEESVLQVGVGHMQNTSLPVGGESTHAVLSGHRGLPTNDLFTNLDKMQIGDTFYIKVLDETLCYTVDQIITVLPYEMESLAIENGKDYVTLVTCTPYGINSHRLLVRGVRSPYDQELQNSIKPKGSFWEMLPTQYRHLLIGLTVIITVLALKQGITGAVYSRKKQHKKEEAHD